MEGKAQPAKNNVRAPHEAHDEYRLINLGQLAQHISDLTLHAATCQKAIGLAMNGQPPIKMTGVARDQGLASLIEAQCQGCARKVMLNSSPKMELNSAGEHFEINVRAVWGEAASGGGAYKLNEQLATMGVPGMAGETFTKIEHEIGEWWGAVLKQELLAAGREERRLAIERGDYHEGIPAITVVGDGGWSKRTHKHSYNALGGVAIIVGAVTGRLLFIGIRNKTCQTCTRAEGRGEEPPQHECFQNWNESSCAMENDIIVEGFLKAEEMHKVRYMRYIGDGDSSVLANLRERGPSWCLRGTGVQKLECANHVCKGIRGKLEKLVTENSHFKGADRLTKSIRVRLTTAIRCAIKMRTADEKTVGHHQATKLLQHDIKNAVRHVLGHHSECSTDFCKAKQKDTESTTSPPEPPADDTEEDYPDPLLQQQQFWTEGTSQEEMEASRLDRPGGPAPIHLEIIQAVHDILRPVVQKADRLIGNYTSNLAENWMSIRAKFDGGKVVNRCQRSAWNTRCYAAALRKNMGPSWSPITWQRVTGQPASQPFQKLYTVRAKKDAASKKSKQKPEVRARARKRKAITDSSSSSKKARQSYGPECTTVTPDVSLQTLEQQTQKFYKDQVAKTSHHGEGDTCTVGKHHLER